MDTADRPHDSIYVARQPILRSTGRVFGYELLYRSTEAATTCTGPTDKASARVMTDAVLSLGLDTLTGRLPAFINLNRDLLLSGAPRLLSPRAVVLELLEDTEIDEAVIDTCRSLKSQGYALALDDFVPGSDAEALLPFVKFVKIDVLQTPAELRLEMARRLLPLGVRMIAEKVETSEIAEDMCRAGYKFLQGYYFCKPKTFRGKSLPARSASYMRLLAELNKPGLCAGDLEDLIKTDVSLSYRVLRCINSAAFALHQEIRSIRHALVMLGLERIQQWASIWLLAGLNVGGIPETATVALVRARSCEAIGNLLGGAECAAEFFLLGLCSLLDTMLGVPMQDALAELPLGSDIRDALLGRTNHARAVLDSVVAYECGQWDTAISALASAGLAPSALIPAYADALRWANELAKQTAAS
jgi:EAL and modified HD-GYP domain-containing signal transduction protein